MSTATVCTRCGEVITSSYERGRCYAEDCEPDVMDTHDEAESITNWPAPTRIRLERARIAWDAHAQGVWGERAALLDGKPGWVQEIWARVAEAALTGDARAAHAKRVELEGRAETWDALPPLGRSIWTDVVTFVRKGRN